MAVDLRDWRKRGPPSFERLLDMIEEKYAHLGIEPPMFAPDEERVYRAVERRLRDQATFLRLT